MSDIEWLQDQAGFADVAWMTNLVTLDITTWQSWESNRSYSLVGLSSLRKLETLRFAMVRDYDPTEDGLVTKDMIRDFSDTLLQVCHKALSL